MELDDLTSLNNQALLMIAEYHLMSASQGTHSVTPIVPGEATRLLPPVDAYLPGDFQRNRDVRVKDQANTLRVTAWLHRLDLAATYGRSVSDSPDVGDYYIGPLLDYFLVPRASSLTFEEVARRVAEENRQDAENSLWELLEQRDELQEAVEFLVWSRDRESNKEAKKPLKKKLHVARKELLVLEGEVS